MTGRRENYSLLVIGPCSLHEPYCRERKDRVTWYAGREERSYRFGHVNKIKEETTRVLRKTGVLEELYIYIYI